MRVYPEPLLERVLGLTPRVEKVSPSLDWSLVPDEPPPRDPHRVRIVYVTSRLQDDQRASSAPTSSACSSTSARGSS